MAASAASLTVVLVHGAWADGSSWPLVIPVLLKQGIAVVAVQSPTTSLAADVEATKTVLDGIEGPVVLVGHSWGGAAGATRPNWSIVSAQDRVVSIELQRELAVRLKAKTTELQASHLSILSQPQAVADVILDALKTVAAS